MNKRTLPIVLKHLGLSVCLLFAIFYSTSAYAQVPAQPDEPTGPNAVCNTNSSAVYSTNQDNTAAAYSWWCSDPNVKINGSSGHTYSNPLVVSNATFTANSATFDFTGATTLSASVGVFADENADGSGSSPNNNYNIFITYGIYNSSNTLTGPTTVCTNQANVAYIASFAEYPNPAYYTFSFSYDNGATVYTSWNNTYLNFSTATSGTLSVYTVNACGTSPTPTTLAITVNNTIPSQPGSITGSTSVCTSETADAYLVTNDPTATSYTWSYDNGAVLTGTTNSASANYSAATSGTLSVVANNSSGCSSTPRTLPVTVNQIPSQPGSVSGSSTVCQNQTAVSYSITAVPGATSYTWTYDGTGATINGTTNNITVDFNSSATSGTLHVTANNSCGNSTEQTFAVTVNTAQNQPGSVTGATTVCQNTTANSYSVTNDAGASSYTWSYSGTGATIHGSTNSVTVDFSTTATNGTLSVVANNSNGCSSVAQTLGITVNTIQSQPGSVTGATTVCQNTTANSYSVTNDAGASSYTWSYSGAGATIHGTTNSVTIDFSSSATSGTLSVFANNSDGCPSVAQTLGITINTAQNQPATITGTTTLCQNTSGVTYSVTNDGGASSYTWSYDGTGATIHGSTNSITIDYNSSATSGTLSVVANNSNGCQSVAQTSGITVNPTLIPGVVLGADQPNIICTGTNVNFTLTPTNGGSSPTYQWYKNNNPAGLNQNTYSDNALALNDVVKAVMTSNATCLSTTTANSNSITFNVQVPPAISGGGQPANSGVCSGATTSFSVSATGSVLTYQWQEDNGGGFSNITDGGIYSGSQTATLTLTGVTVGMNGYHYQVIVSGACTPSASSNGTATLSVTNPPNLSTSLTATVCDNNVFHYSPASTTAGTAFAWSRSSVVGISNGSASGTNDPAETLHNTTSAPVNVTYVYTLTANGCVNVNNVVVTVYPTPDVTLPSNQAVCNNAAQSALSFSSSVSGTTYTWTNNAATIGIGATGTGSIGSFTAINAGSSNVVATIAVTPSANGCPGTAQNFTITVYPTPDVTLPSNQTVCNNATQSALSFSSSVSGTTYTWTNDAATIGIGATGTGSIGSFTAINAGSSNILATIAVTPGANGCAGTAQNFTITVYPTPDVTVPSNQTVCNNATQSALSFSSSVGGTTYTWTNDAATIGIGATGTGSIGSFTAINAGSSNVMATIAVTPTANGCAGTAQNFTITVYPTPDVTVPSNQTVCNNATQSALSFSSGVSGTTYTWTNNAATIGIGATGTGSIGSFTAINAGSSNVVATIAVTPTTNGCAGTAQNFTITVYPTPDVTVPSNQTVCNNATQSALSFSSSVGGTTYTWTNDAATIGIGATGTGSISSFTATNAGSSNVVATIAVTPTTNGCAGTAQNFTITVNITPVVTSVSNQTVCNGAAFSTINFSGNNAGNAYSWTNTQSSIGLDVSGTGNIASFNGSNSGSAPVSGNVVVTPTFTNNSVTCTGSTTSFSLTVNQTPIVNGLSDQTVCNGSAFSAVSFSGNNGSNVYNWANSQSSIGLLATGTGNIASFNGINSGSAPVTGNVVITPSFTNNSVTCIGSTTSFNLTVNQTPTVNGLSDQTVCNGAAFSVVSFSGNNAGNVYDWANSQSSIGLLATGAGNIASFNGINSGSVPVTGNVVVTPIFTNNSVTCAGSATSFNLTVNQTPIVNGLSDQTVCNGSAFPAIAFSGNNGSNAYSWANSQSSIGLLATGTGNIASFNGINSGNAPVTGNVVVTPSFTNNSVTCTGSTTSFNLTVNQTPTVNGLGDQTVCNGSAFSAISFSGNNGSNVYNWANSQSSIGLLATGTGNIASFNGVNSGNAVVTGNVVVTPTFTNNSVTCTGSAISFNLTVNQTPIVNGLSDQTVCNGSAFSAIVFSGNNGSNAYSWANSQPSIGLLATGTGNIASFNGSNSGIAPVTGNIVVTPSFTNNSVTCTGSTTSFNLTVNQTPAVNSLGDQTVCNGSAFSAISFSGNNGSNVYSWANSQSSIGLLATGTGNIASFNGINSGNAPVTGNVVVTPSFTNNSVTCTGSTTNFNLTVNQIPTINGLSDQTVCNSSAFTAVSFSGNNAGNAFSWTNSQSSIGLLATGTGNIASFNASNSGSAPVTGNIVVTPTFTNNSVTCTGSTTAFNLTVNQTPTVNGLSDQTVCNGSAFSAITFSGNNGSNVYSWANSQSSIGLLATGTGNIASFNGINSGNAPVTGNVVVMPSFTNNSVTCTGSTTNFNLTVNQIPTINGLSDQTVCNGSAFTAISFSGNNGSNVYSWANNQSSIGLLATGTGNIASFNGSNSGSTPVTGNVVVTPSFTNNSVTCTGATTSFNLTVNQTPTVNGLSDQTVCNGSAFSAITFSGNNGSNVYNWVNSQSSIGLLATGTGNIASFNGSNSGNAPVTGNVVVTPTFTNNSVTCTGATTSFNLTVNQTPVVNSLSDQTVCNGSAFSAITFSGNNGSNVYNWTNSQSSIGLLATGTGNIASFNGLNSGSAPVTGNVVVTPSFTNNSVTCTGSTTNFNLTVNQIPTVNGLSDQTVCNGSAFSAITFSGNNGSNVYNWANSQSSIGLLATGTGNIATFNGSNSGNAPVTGNVVVTPTFSNNSVTCTGSTTSFNLTVNQTPSINPVSDQTVCNGSAFSGVIYAGNNAGNVYNWTNTQSIIGLASNGTGNISSFNGLNLGSTYITAVVTATPSFTNNAVTCTGSSTSFNLTVNATPTVNSISNQTVCNGTAFSAINFTSIVATTPSTVYTWTNNQTSIGLGATGTGNVSSFNGINSGTTFVDAGVTVTPSFTYNSLTCNGSNKSFTLTVNPTPTVNAISDQTVCGGSPFAAISFSGNVTTPATVYTWANNTTSIGLAATGTGNIASFTGTNFGFAPATGNVIVTPNYTHNALTCQGSTTNFNLTVNPIPTVNSVSDQTVCHNTPTANVVFTGAVSGTVFTWTNTQTSIGLAATGTGSISSFTGINNSGVSPVTGNIVVTPSYTLNAMTCFGATTSFNITVNPLPSLTSASSLSAQCSNLTLSYNPTASTIFTTTTYAWTRATVSNITPVGPTSGNGNPNEFLINTTGNTTNVGIAVTYVYTLTAYGCTNPTTFPVTVTINPRPDQPAAFTLEFPTANAWDSVCQGQTTEYYQSPGTGVYYNVPSNLPYAVSYAWGYSGTGISNIGGTTNTVNAWYSTSATSGTLGVYAINTYGCYSLQPRAKSITVIPYNIWMGPTNGNNNWDDTTNWILPVIPNQTISAHIPSAFYPAHITTGVQYVNNFIADLGVVTTIYSGSNLRIIGDMLSMNGIIKGPGYVTFAGNTPQLFVGATNKIDNLELNNINGLTISPSFGNTLYVANNYLPTAGVLTTNGAFVLYSDANSTGAIAQGSGSYISGNVVCEKYIHGGSGECELVTNCGRDYRFLGNPFSTSIALTQLTDNIDITGTGGQANGFENTQTNAPSAFWYDPTSIVANGSPINDPGWTAFTNTNGSGANAWNQYEGIRVFYRGAKYEGLWPQVYIPSATTLDMTGPINMGDQSIPLIHNNVSSYNVLSNPYPANVDMSLTTRASSIGANFWVWDPNQGTLGAYVSQPFNISYILPAYAAFVATTSASTNNTILFQESNKVYSTASGNLFKSTSGFGDNTVQLRILSNGDSLSWDRLLLMFNGNALSQKDDLDAVKLYNAALDFYTYSTDNQQLSIDVRPYVNGQIIPLGLKTSVMQSYTIRVDDYNVAPGVTLYLHDYYLNQTKTLSKGMHYDFTVTSDSATQGDKRFELNLSGATSVATSNNLKVVLAPNPATDNTVLSFETAQTGNTSITISNLLGLEVYRKDLGQRNIGSVILPLNALAEGIYLVTVKCGDQTATQRLVKE